MSLILSGTNGVSDVDGTAATPAIRGTDTNTGIFFPAADTIAFAEGGTESMRLDSAGNVGIGTSSPTATLDVNAALPSAQINATTGTNRVWIRAVNSGGDFYFGRENSAGSSFGVTAYSALLWSQGAHPMVFATNNTERMRLDSSGNLGLGVTPSAWSGAWKAIQVGSIAAFTASGTTATYGCNWYDDGTAARYVTNGFAARYTTNNAGQHQWFTAPSGTAGNAISFTQSMTLDASGNLGLGATSISNARLQIKGANNSGGVFTDGLRVTSNNETVDVKYSWTGIDASSELRLATAGSERARIDSSGNLLVGTTTAGDGKVRISASANAFNLLKMDDTGSTGGNYIQFLNSSGAQAGAINHNGTTSVNYGSGSDYRLKENIQPMTGALAKVAALKPVTYKWKVDGSAGQGFIAHELQEVIPDAVVGQKDEVDAEGNHKYQTVDTSFVVATLTAALQEQQAIIQTLTTRIAALEAK